MNTPTNLAKPQSTEGTQSIQTEKTKKTEEPDAKAEKGQSFFPLHRVFQFALFVRYYLQYQILGLLKEYKMTLLKGLPQTVGMIEHPPVSLEWIWLAAEKAALFFVEKRFHDQKIDYLDYGMIDKLIDSYDIRSKFVVSDADQERPLSLSRIGSSVSWDNKVALNSGMQLMIESVRHHLYWLHNSIVDKSTMSMVLNLALLRSDRFVGSEKSQAFVERTLKDVRFVEGASQLIFEVASVVLADAFLHPDIKNVGYHQLTSSEFAVVQSRFVEYLKVKLLYPELADFT